MEIKNLFDLAKADKYTADGRDQIVDARKTYQVGEISQATGLQKTANGWVKPKNGAGAQKQEAGSKENKMDIGSTVKVKVNGGREGKITGIRGDVVTVEMPAQGDKPARRDQYYKSDLEAAGEQKRTDNTTGKDYKEGQTVPQAKAMQSTMQHREKQAMQVYSKLKQEGASSDQTYAAAQLVRSSRELGDLLGVIGKDPEDPLNEATAEKLNSMMQEHAKLQKEVDSIQEHREASEATVTNTMTDLKRKGKIEDYWSLGYANEDAAKNKLRSVYNINNDDDVEKVWTSIKKEYLKKNADRYDPEDLKNVMENAGIKPEDLNNEAKNPAEENKKKYGPVQRKYKDVDVHTKDIGQLPEEEQKKWYVMWDNVITNKFKDQYRTLQAKEKGVTKWDIPTPDVNFDKESGLITVWTDKGKEFYKTKISGIQRTEVDPKTGEAKKQDYDLYHRDADGNKDMEESISFEGAGTKDSAPLTGDTRVKLSQICDAARKTYQVGEISQATGLQKTATGWVKPKETKYGKVTQKEGTWGVQQKLGKGSKFIPHKNESDAKNALSNYTAGYNTTERSKEDPHSDKARQQKRWNEKRRSCRTQS